MAALPDEPKTFRQTGRFYENEFPEVETTVVVQVLKIDDKIGAYVSLLEYDGKEGMINLGELSKKRIRSMAKILRIGSIEVCMVMSVDEEKGYINLSKKRVEPEDAPPKLEQFAKAKAVHGIMQHVSGKHGLEVEEMCAKVSWKLHNKYPSAFEAFKRHTEGDINIWEELDVTGFKDENGNDLEEDIKQNIETHMKRRLIASTLRLMAKCEVSCHEYEGIDAIKEALQEGFKASKEDCEVNIKLIAHPVFALTCMCRDKELGVQVLTQAMEHVKEAILEKKGGFTIVSLPSIQKNDPKPGDDDSDEDGEGGSEKGSYKSEDDPEEQEVDMGDLNADDIAALEKIKVDDD